MQSTLKKQLIGVLFLVLICVVGYIIYRSYKSHTTEHFLSFRSAFSSLKSRGNSISKSFVKGLRTAKEKVKTEWKEQNEHQKMRMRERDEYAKMMRKHDPYWTPPYSRYGF